MRFDIHHHYDTVLLERIVDLLGTVITQQESIMATLDQVLADVTDESTAIDGISALLAGLKQQLADALAGTTLPPPIQAKVDAIFAQAETNKAKIADALAANTPPPAPPTT
jgi:hypothetical protein